MRKFLRRCCKCHTVFVTCVGLPCTPLTNMRVCFVLGCHPCWNSTHRHGMSPLRWYESLFSALVVSFLLREQFSSSRLHSKSEPLVLSKLFKGCWVSWPQRLRYFSWAWFTCGPLSTGWNFEFLHMLGITVSSVSKWTRPALQLWPLGKTICGWNGA